MGNICFISFVAIKQIEIIIFWNMFDQIWACCLG